MDEARGISCKIHVVAGDIIPYGSWYGPVPELEFQTIPEWEPGINDSSIKVSWINFHLTLNSGCISIIERKLYNRLKYVLLTRATSYIVYYKS